MKQTFFNRLVSGLLVGVMLALVPSISIAASISDISDEMTNLTKSQTSSHQIQFITPTGLEAGTDTIILTFQSDFAVGALTFADMDIAEGNTSCAAFGDLTLAATPGADIWGVATTSSSITFTAPSSGTTGYVAAGNCIQIQIGTQAAAGTNRITNTSTAGNKTIGITGAFGDSGTTTVAILDNSQVQLTAEVAQSITFSISHNSASFGTLSSAGARYATSTGTQSSESIAHTLSAGTNASYGYVVMATGTTLISGVNSITAIGGTAASSTIATEQFGMRFVESGAGTGTVTAPYAYTTSYANDFANGDQIASATGATDTSNYAAYYIANIASNTEAGSYSTSLTYVATANY